CRAALSKRNRGPVPLAKRLQRKELMRGFPITSFAVPFLAAYVYLGTTRAHSVTSYTGGGSLEERGATWLFLRRLASQKGEGIFGRLVQTSNTGIALACAVACFGGPRSAGAQTSAGTRAAILLTLPASARGIA